VHHSPYQRNGVQVIDGGNCERFVDSQVSF
jgi:hypothetical protein